MGAFIIEEPFWEIFPEARIGIVIARGIDNRCREGLGLDKLLAEANSTAKQYLQEEVFSENPAVAVWRAAFQKFKTKKGARCSIEAMLKRINNDGEIGCINPLVDLYNAISLAYGLPCGGEDLDRFQGALRLTLAEGGEAFRPLGSEADEPPYPGEVVYKDDGGAVCRCWNWREAQRTMLTEETVNAFLCIESVDPARDEDFGEAVRKLSALTAETLGGSTELYFLTKDQPEIEF